MMMMASSSEVYNVERIKMHDNISISVERRVNGVSEL